MVWLSASIFHNKGSWVVGSIWQIRKGDGELEEYFVARDGTWMTMILLKYK